MSKPESPNTTLNMLVSLDGPEYYNLIDGATNTMQFLQVFEEAGNCVNLQTGRPCLQVGDIIVMDNFVRTSLRRWGNSRSMARRNGDRTNLPTNLFTRLESNRVLFQ